MGKPDHEQVLEALLALSPRKQVLVREMWPGGVSGLHHTQVLEALLALSPRKQVLVFEMWSGITVDIAEGLRITARSGKELGRFRNARDAATLEWMSGFEPGEVFYDIGANVGALTLSAAAMHGDCVRVVAIEPAFANFESLVRNLSLNGLLGTTIPLQVALLDRTGLEPMNYRDSTAAGTSLHTIGAAVDQEGQYFTPAEVQLVPTYTLDDLIAVLKLPPPTRIKIDVDGYEEPVLRGATRTLRAGTVRELMVEVVDHDGSGIRLESASSLLGRHGYEVAQVLQHSSHGQGESYVADYLFSRRKALSVAAELQEVLDNPLEPENDLAEKTREATARKAKHSARKELAHDMTELRSSYYLSGATKKLDVREIDGFSEVAGRAISDARTSMNYDRLYTLWQAVQSAPPELAIVEVGTYSGGSAKFIGEALRYTGRSPRFYVCDTFNGHPRTDPTIDTVHHGSHKFQDISAEAVAEYLADHSNIEIVVGDIVETSAQLARESFGFVHIDVDVYPATDFCLRFFAPRLASGAVIVVDDYGFLTCPGAKKAVDEFIAQAPDFRLFHLLTGQAVLFRGLQRPLLKRVLARYRSGSLGASMQVSS